MSQEPRDDLEEREEAPRITFRGSSRPKRVYLPWWALAGIGGLVGFAVSQWVGLVAGFILGAAIWKLR